MSEGRFSGEQPKKFEINQPEEKKKFQINETSPKKFEIKKKFIVHTETGRDISLEWFQQKNSNDCGPCLLLNGLRLLHVESIPNSIDEVRETVNQMRREKGRPELPSNGWFTSEDVGEYLAQVAGMEVEEYPVYPYDAENVKQQINWNISQRPYELMYTTVGNHFRAVAPTSEPNQFYLLDSFLNEPKIISQGEAQELLERTVSSRSENRVERVGVARKSQIPSYRVNM